MPERMVESPDNREYLLSLALEYLRGLHQSSCVQPDEFRTTKRWEALNPPVRKNIGLLLRGFRQKLEEHGRAFEWPSGRIAKAYGAAEEGKLQTALKGRWHDHILSTPGHPIQYQRYGSYVLTQELERIAMDTSSPEQFGTCAWLFFDTNHLKSINECIGHPNGCRFLQRTAQLLLDPQTETRQWLDKLGITVTACSAGGDEFALLLRSGSPISPALLQEIIRRYQTEISASKELRACVNFDDPNVLMNTGLSEKERKNFLKNPPAKREERLRKIREELPDIFVPSVAAGAVRLDEAILWAMNHQVEEQPPLFSDANETFESACQKIIIAIGKLSEAREKADKSKQLQTWEKTDTKQWLFAQRNRQNRVLAKRTAGFRGLIEKIIGVLVESNAVAESEDEDADRRNASGLDAQQTAEAIAQIIIEHDAVPEVRSMEAFRRGNNGGDATPSTPPDTP
ncbi:TPA: hypothetical protein DCL30_02475 [Candidatus Peribacteria bacterium]|nr:MAG: hypothetical protein A3J91_04355 [Candidatus Peribacteria bacterium RIFOXYC2_FULL_58_10]OGJ85115.1 MAG: hypothetical protein A2529_01445 [Candidatus Peribacteria bacterium RIFOXYD2_FULL_58_15]HAI98387.1 hypothetical protein [Candidatus Peribacteria bacterium]HAS33808.1 hypothetical protein [Candidatus Peribacteria bacterium]